MSRPALPSCRSLRLTGVRSASASPSVGTGTPGVGFFGWTTITSLLADGVGDPASASASMSDMLPVIMYLPGARTSPMTNTLWLLYCSISTRTCGYRIYPFDSIDLSRSCSTAIVTPDAATRPMSGNVTKPSASTRYLPVRSGSSKTVTVSRSSGPTTYRCAVAGTGGASGLGAAGCCGAAAAGGFCVCGGGAACGIIVSAISQAAARMVVSISSLLRTSRQRNPELARLPVQIGTLNAERLRSGGHLPPMMLEHRGNVLALEAEARLAQIADRPECGRRAVEPQH